MKRFITYLLLLLPALSFAQTPGGRLNTILIRRPAGGPNFTVNPIFLAPYSNVTGTASTAQYVVVSGSLLTNSVLVAAASGMQYSLTQGGTYTSTLTLTPTSGTVYDTVWIRVAAATAANTYSGSINFTSTGVTGTVSCTYSATVSSSGSPTVVFSPTSFSTPFSTSTLGPSASQSFVVTGTNMSNNLLMNAPASFLFSTNNSSFTNTVTLTESGGSINQTIWVQLPGGLSPGNYSGSITCSSTGVSSPPSFPLFGTVTSSGSLDSIKINFALTNTTSGGNWVNVLGQANDSVISGVGGNTGSITWTTVATANWSGYGTPPTCAATNNGYASATFPVPANVLKDSWFSFQTGGSYSPSSPKFRFGNLIAGKQYMLIIFGSLTNLGFTMSTDYRAVGDVLYGPTTINCKQNANTAASWTMYPDASNNITIWADPSSSNQLGVMTCVELYQITP